MEISERKTRASSLGTATWKPGAHFVGKKMLDHYVKVLAVPVAFELGTVE